MDTAARPGRPAPSPQAIRRGGTRGVRAGDAEVGHTGARRRRSAWSRVARGSAPQRACRPAAAGRFAGGGAGAGGPGGTNASGEQREGKDHNPQRRTCTTARCPPPAAGPLADRGRLARPARDPSLVWKTVETEHFASRYYEPRQVARRVAVVAERPTGAGAGFRHQPGGDLIVITDEPTAQRRQRAAAQLIRLFASPVSHSALNDHDDGCGLTAHVTRPAPGFDRPACAVQPRGARPGRPTRSAALDHRGSGHPRNPGAARQPGPPRLFDAELRVATGRHQHDIAAISHGPQRGPHGNVAYLHGHSDYASRPHATTPPQVTWD